LANWHGGNKRWQQAESYFHELVFNAHQQDPHIELGDVTMLYLSLAPLLVEIGDGIGYEKFRKSAIAEFGNDSNATTCERLLTSCLLLPLDDDQTITYDKWAKHATEGVSLLNSFTCWTYIALGLFEHRRGNDAQAINWSQKCLALRSPPTCRVRANVVLAMAYSRLKDYDNANSQLKQCRSMIEAKLQGELGVGTYESGFWKDWLIDDILLREATVQLDSVAMSHANKKQSEFTRIWEQRDPRDNRADITRDAVMPTSTMPIPAKWNIKFFEFQDADQDVVPDNWKAVTHDNPLAEILVEQIEFNWGGGGPAPDVPFDQFAVVANTKIKLEAGTYQVETISDDGVRVWIDDQLVIDNWTGHTETHDKATLDLDAGYHSITIDYFDSAYDATLKFAIGQVNGEATAEASSINETSSSKDAPAVP
jgi:hypothetical protein